MSSCPPLPQVRARVKEPGGCKGITEDNIAKCSKGLTYPAAKVRHSIFATASEDDKPSGVPIGYVRIVQGWELVS